MRKTIKIVLAALVTFSFAVLGGCKKEAATTEEITTPADTATAIVPDTTATTVNDSNVSGTTSGKMEQVP